MRPNESLQVRTGRATQRVVVVNGSKAVFDLLESVLDAGHYDVVLVADIDRAYSQIKQNRPDMVVVCLGLDDPVGFQILSMLKLDEDTKDIPVLTCASEFELEPSTGEDDEEEQDGAFRLATAALPMN